MSLMRDKNLTTKYVLTEVSDKRQKVSPRDQNIGDPYERVMTAKSDDSWATNFSFFFSIGISHEKFRNKICWCFFNIFDIHILELFI